MEKDQVKTISSETKKSLDSAETGFSEKHFFKDQTNPGYVGLIICFIFYFTGLGIYSYYRANDEYSGTVSAIDKRLLLAASSLQHMLPEDFHDRAVAPDSIDKGEELLLRRRISRFARESEFKYLYTLVKWNDKFYFTAPTVTPEEEKERDTWYFYPYDTIPDIFVDAYRTGQIRYVTYSDQWGEFRSIALPLKSPAGRVYLSCADYEITYLKRLFVQSWLHSLFTAFYLTLLTIPFLFLFRQVAVKLSNANIEMWKYKENLEDLVSERTQSIKSMAWELTVSQERLDLALSGAKLSLFDWDISSGSLILGPLIAKSLGLQENSMDRMEDYTSRMEEEDRIFFERLSRTSQRIEKGERGFFSRTTKIKNDDGGFRWLNHQGSFLELDSIGRPQRIIGVVKDVTLEREADAERKRNERKVIQARRFESLGRMAGGIAHDFNNLLMVILGNVDLCLFSMPEDSPYRENVQGIRDATLKASHLSGQMRLYSGDHPAGFQCTNLKILLEEMIGSLRELLPAHIGFRVTLQSDEVYLNGNSTTITTAIQNLIINAVEAIGDSSGAIALNMKTRFCDHEFLRREWDFAELQPGDYAEISIIDNGPGMDSETGKRLFEPFFTTKFPGRGLGLPAVHGIMRVHRGLVVFNSSSGNGASFTLFFPLMQSSVVSRTTVMN
ncbi:MAG: hypothetical protein CVV64_09970 [Candidatus Wallbacteria bacterium HGW-Wallbacteria-1]|jgi:signal transduction histidine kinase|uniref:histidine kinase n=1 Tax=Candidatus Wallbacteria bacterium HGW-Wallbacteria-1 TaxID=2013854 RepID=A0A2N1PPL6_9BACT|nr:MAG: hypothetical protein CVV64_09970 [Candidatus Wallbacteria bacterium HGW-Wallbacteria-1]